MMTTNATADSIESDQILRDQPIDDGMIGSAQHIEYLLRLGDNSLVLGQRLSEWCGRGPILEEDIALANIALDLIGQARLVLSYAGRLEDRGRDEDALAFLRDARDFRNCTMAELPNGYALDAAVGNANDLDFALAIVRIFLVASFQSLQWQMLATSRDSELSAIAMTSLKEARYHEDHAAEWLIRLGDGTEESHARVERALSALWPYTSELFLADDIDRVIADASIGVDPSTIHSTWLEGVSATLDRATLPVPTSSLMLTSSAMRTGGKFGAHSEHLGPLLAEMQFLQRAYPNGSW
jgi:ring-1,2-phenylacetyl-CoA epoxidase subunit PaaC